MVKLFMTPYLPLPLLVVFGDGLKVVLFVPIVDLGRLQARRATLSVTEF